MSASGEATPESLRALAAALEDERLTPPYSSLSIQRFVPTGSVEAASREILACAALEMAPRQVARLLRRVADERDAAVRSFDGVELVWSGPEVGTSSTRDTAIVVRELFSSARRSVLLSGFAVHNGRRVFAALAANADANPGLRVRMFLNVERKRRDTRADSEVVREFAERLRGREWPGRRFPEVFYDRRSLSAEFPRASLHAKCIVVDEQRALVTSANLTEAAQERNLEAGVLIESAVLARTLIGQFEMLIAQGSLLRLPGLG